MANVGDKFYTDMRGIHAEAVVTEKGFKVLKGSIVKNHETSYASKSILEYRRECIANGIVKEWKLAED